MFQDSSPNNFIKIIIYDVFMLIHFAFLNLEFFRKTNEPEATFIAFSG